MKTKEQKKKEGYEYENFISSLYSLYSKSGRGLSFYMNEDQFHGETEEKIEIKYDDVYKYTRNLWIEYAEKQEDSPWFKSSGIHKEDDVKYYLQGDYQEFFVFYKKDLQNIFDNKKKEVIFDETDTSQGMLLTRIQCFENCVRYIRIVDNRVESEDMNTKQIKVKFLK